MSNVLGAVVVFSVAVALMAVGVMFGRRAIKGSCGGLAGLRDEQGNPLCEGCDAPQECDEFKSRFDGRKSFHGQSRPTSRS